MSFINKISEKLSSGATAVSNSTKRMSEIAKLNSKINKNLSDVNSKYTEIGRIVKLELVDKIEHQEVKRLVSEIDALLTEVNESREKIRSYAQWNTPFRLFPFTILSARDSKKLR